MSRIERDILISGLSHIEIMAGGLARFVVFVERFDPQTQRGFRQYPPAIVMPVVAVPDAIAKAMNVTAVTMVDSAKRYLLPNLH